MTAIPQGLFFRLNVLSLFFRLHVLSWLVEPAALTGPVKELSALCAMHDLPYFAAVAKILEGHIIACEGDPDAGRTVIEEGLARYDATEAVTWSCYYRALLAEAYLTLGDAHNALDILTSVLDQTERTGEKCYAAELHRRIGDAHRQRGDDRLAEQHFKLERICGDWNLGGLRHGLHV